MFLTILGAILLLIPFLLIFYFKNRILAFIYVLTISFAFHIFIGLVLQYFHFFRYPIVLAIHLLIAFCIIVFFLKNKHKFSFKIKVDWIVIISLGVIIFELWSVHYLYTGEISTINGNKNVVHLSYPYPLFSDEWAGVAFTNYSIENNSLPITNPLLDGLLDKDFRNIFIAFFSGLAEIFLILSLDPIIGFPILAIIAGSLICWLVYLFLRSSRVANFPSLIGALCLPWIINSVNLPGIWYLFPFIGGSILFLASLIALNYKDRKLAVVSGFISLLLYPPFIVIIAPTLIAEFLLNHELSLKKIILILSSCIGLSLIAAGLIFIFQKSNWPVLLQYFIDSLVRMNNQGCIPTRGIWYVIPMILLPIAFVGFISVIKKKIFHLIIPLSIGLLYWSAYAFFPKFLIIDYARIVVVTSYLIIITIGFGVSEIFSYLRGRFKPLEEKNIFFAMEIIILAVFVILSFSYTRNTSWKNIVLRYEWPTGTITEPIFSPVNNYLNQDDLNLFKGISKKRFLSIPWKGLVIGAATGNYPVQTKPSIITNHSTSYDWFMLLNCTDKDSEARMVKIEYLYSHRIDCPNFIELGHSQEGLYLYKFQP